MLLQPTILTRATAEQVVGVLPPLPAQLATELDRANERSLRELRENDLYPYAALSRSAALVDSTDNSLELELRSELESGALDRHPQLAALVALRLGDLEQSLARLDSAREESKLTNQIRLLAYALLSRFPEALIPANELGEAADVYDLQSIGYAHYKLGKYALAFSAYEKAYWRQPSPELARTLLTIAGKSRIAPQLRKWAVRCINAAHHSQPVLKAALAVFLSEFKILAAIRIYRVLKKREGLKRTNQ